jgi:hypothetical protein
LEQAEECARTLLERQQRAGDAEGTLRAMQLLVTALRVRRQYAEAEVWCRKLVQAHEASRGARDSVAIASVNNLALLLKLQGELGEAERLYRQVLDVGRARWGHGHPHLLASVNNLASVLAKAFAGKHRHLPPTEALPGSALAELLEIEALYEQAWDAGRNVLGASHPRLQTIKCGKEYVRRCKLRCRPVARADAD